MDTLADSLQRAQELELRIADCDAILEHACAFLNGRWVDNAHGFQKTEMLDHNVHLMNTASAVQVILRNPSIFNLTTIEAFDHVSVQNVLKYFQAQYKTEPQGQRGTSDVPGWTSGKSVVWSPYICSLVLGTITATALHDVKAFSSFCTTDKYITGTLQVQVAALAEFLDRFAKQGLSDTIELLDCNHPYFALNALDTLNGCLNIAPGLQLLVADRWKTVRRDTLVRLREILFSQMTYKLAGLHQHVDIGALTYALAAILRYGGDSRWEMTDDLVDLAIDLVFTSQQKSGLWDTATPLLGAQSGQVGCSSVEIAFQLLQMPRVKRRFTDFIDHFHRLFIHLSRGFDKLQPERGWAVDIRREGGTRQTWYGSFVLEYLTAFRVELREYAAGLVRRGFRYSRVLPKKGRGWAEQPLSSSVRERINENIIDPWRSGSREKAKCSIILFGPPGTGKTSFATALAHEVGWGLIEIGPNDFLADGIDGVFARGDLIFQRLLLLEKVVVLFDEIEEFVVDRQNQESEKIDRFLTTYMLPWVQRLRDKASLIFIFATNDLRRFDSAIKRVGRFDIKIPLGPPEGDERAKMLQKLVGHLLSAEHIRELNGSLLPQTTWGDITEAIEQVKNDSDAAGRFAKLRMILLDEKNLTTTTLAWQQFDELRKRYSS